MTSRPGPKLVTLLAALAVGTAAAHGYPISPQPLWQLVEKADVIVYAEVDDVVKPRLGRLRAMLSPGSDPPPTVAELHVLEAWKGTRLGQLQVDFHPNFICPAPPRYVEGERVLAFLAWHEGRLRTVGLSYGTLYPTDDALEGFRTVVRRAIELQQRKELSTAARVEWAVEAASRKGTRWHGLYELHPQADSMHTYYDRGIRPLAAERLSAAQVRRIARGFAAAPTADVTLPMVLSIAHGHESPALDLAAVAAMEAVLARDSLPYWFEDALALVLLRFGDAEPAARLARICDSEYCRAEPEAARRLWDEAREELQIPAVEPLEPEVPVVWGVGSLTPS